MPVAEAFEELGPLDAEFPELAELLETLSPNSSFIPEIWQGHKDMGSGFWLALSRLEKWF